MTIKALQTELKEKIKDENLIADCDMGKYTSFRTGGKADLLILPDNEEELMFALQKCAGSGIEYMVMGNGSNILVRDGGYRGVMIKLGEAFAKTHVDGEQVFVGSGALMSSVARVTLDAGLTGFEFASGIPGSMGGAAFMNAGAYDGEMKDIIKEVTVIAKDGSGKKHLSCEDMQFGYRHSVLYETGGVVLSVVLGLKKGEADEISGKMKELMRRRNEKQPVNLPSAGSFFKRPKGYFAGKLIQDAGLKGLLVGGAQVSELHSGFVVNTGKATATDIVKLMEIVQATVFDKFGVKLEPEVRIIGE